MSGLVFDNNSNRVLGQSIQQKNITGNRTTGNTVLHASVLAINDRATAESQLQGANPSYYTNAFLRTQTTNDLIFAARSQFDAANIG